jgi:hypothetical protein
MMRAKMLQVNHRNPQHFQDGLRATLYECTCSLNSARAVAIRTMDVARAVTGQHSCTTCPVEGYVMGNATIQ